MVLLIGEKLSRICRYFLSYKTNSDIKEKTNNVQEVRTRKMMIYIQENYQKSITLNDIACSIGISSRECSRYFKNDIEKTSIKYLMHYRIRKSLELLPRSDDNTTEISEK